jgi:hypothetical protein
MNHLEGFTPDSFLIRPHPHPQDLFESSSYADGGAFNWNDIVKYSQQGINYLPTSAYFNLKCFEIFIKFYLLIFDYVFVVYFLIIY